MATKPAPFHFFTHPLDISALTKVAFLLLCDCARLFLAMIPIYFPGALSILLPQLCMDSLWVFTGSFFYELVLVR